MRMTATIYMPLLNEGTEAWRPVAVEPLGDGMYRILDGMPSDEEWAFLPGETVICCNQLFQGEEKLVALRKA